MTDTVTGRTYTSTRPRGLAPWRPSSKTKPLLEATKAVLDEYEAHLPLTIRQCFYRLVGTEVIGKTENDYARLCEMVNRARRGGLLPWHAFRDDGNTAQAVHGYSSPSEFWATVSYSAKSYKRDRAAGQPEVLEVWVEAAGMVPQIARLAKPYGITVYSAGGFDSTTGKHSAAQRALNRAVPTRILHIGDHDPSGCAIVDSAADDLGYFVADYGRPGILTFDRIVVTPEQIARFELPTAPQKAKDKRGEAMAETVQAEALPPDVLASEVQRALEAAVDLDVWQSILDAEEAEREEVAARISEFLAVPEEPEPW